MPPISLNGNSLSIDIVIDVAYNQTTVSIHPDALNKVKASQDFIQQKVANQEVVYGVTTGFGWYVNKVIQGEAAIELQKNLLLSHACGVGQPFSTEIVRAIMLIRLNTLLKGHSGIRVKTVQLLADLLNKKIHPIVPQQGSVGASGDLCPLSHMALVLIGEGMAEIEGRVYSGQELKVALAQKGIEPIDLVHKEGIALNNGTTIMAALGVLAVHKSHQLLRLATLSAALLFEGFGARKAAFDSKVHYVRQHTGQAYIGKLLNQFLEKSSFLNLQATDILTKLATLDIDNEHTELLKKLATHKKITQDAYSIRCTPQVFGASYQAIKHAEEIIENELNAVVDNPIIWVDENEVLSAGNFHGQPIALVLDYLKLAIAEIGNLLERQINKLLDPHHNHELPAMLIDKGGLHSGWMVAQYTAASLVSENKVLVHPASADSIPTCANQEDHVSMGPIAGRQALEILHNVEKILAIHLGVAAQSVDLRSKQFTNATLTPPQLGIKTNVLYKAIRQQISFLDKDRFLYTDIQQLINSLPLFYELLG